MRVLASVVVLVVAGGSAGGAGQMLDRVVARIGSDIITQTDVVAARGLGIIAVEPGADADRLAVERLIDRRLMLAEVTRFPPEEPSAASIEAQVALFTQHAGPDLERLMRTTGLDDRRVEAHARDELRLRAYLDQRFGLSVQVSDDEVRQYYDANREAFSRDGVVAPFEQVEGLARQGAAAQRRAAVVGQWVRDLRARREIVVVGER